MQKLAAVFPLLALASQVTVAQNGFQGPGRYEIRNLKSGKVIDLDRNDGRSVIQYASRQTDNQHWDILAADSGYYFFRNAMNGNALEAVRDRNSTPLEANAFNGGPNQQWRIERGKDGNALIVARNGKAIDVPDGTDRDGARLQIYDLNGDSNQRYILRYVGNAGVAPYSSSAAGQVYRGGIRRGTAGHPAQDDAMQACQNEASARIQDLPISSIFVSPGNADADGNFMVRWRTSRDSSGYCRVSRGGRIVEFRVEQMAR